MAILTFDELLNGRDQDSIRELLFAKLNKVDFPVNDLESGATVRTVGEACAAAVADNVASLVPRIAGGGFLEEADDDWLATLAHENYAIEKIGASYTVQLIKVQAAQGVGPYSVAAGDIILQSTAGNRYILSQSGTIPLGTATGFAGADGTDYKALLFKAESPGAKYADAAGTVTRPIAAPPGVSAINSAPAFSAVSQAGTGTGVLSLGGTPTGPARYQIRISASGQQDVATFDYSIDGGGYVPGGSCASAGVVLSGGAVVQFTNGVGNPSFVEGDVYAFSTPGSPIVVQGQDEETSAALALRMQARWPSLAEVPTTDIYEQWARAASTEVTKVTVTPNNSAAAPGRVSIVIAGLVNPIATAAVQTYIDLRAGITDHPVVSAATVVSIGAAGSVLVKARDLVRIQTDAQAAWQSYVAELPIGGTVRVAKLMQILMDAGAVDFFSLAIGTKDDLVYPDDVNYPDFTVAANEVMQVTPNDALATLLTWILV